MLSDVSAAFVRLRDANNGEESEAVYDPSKPLSVTHTTQEALDGPPQRTRILNYDLSGRRLPVAVLPIGLNSASGLMAIASAVTDFPSESEMLMASVVANHASIASRTACLREEAEVERRRLQELLSQAPAAIALLNGPEHRWTYVNDLYIRVTGRKSARDFIGKTLHEALPELEGQGYIELFDRFTRRESPSSAAKCGQPSIALCILGLKRLTSISYISPY